MRQALDLGLDAIGVRCFALGATLRDLLADVSGVSTHDLGERRCAIVTASVAGVPATDIAAHLARAGVNVTTTVPEHTQFDTEDRGGHPLVRLSPHVYNIEDELDRAVRAIAELRT